MSAERDMSLASCSMSEGCFFVADSTGLGT